MVNLTLGWGGDEVRLDSNEKLQWWRYKRGRGKLNPKNFISSRDGPVKNTETRQRWNMQEDSDPTEAINSEPQHVHGRETHGHAFPFAGLSN